MTAGRVLDSGDLGRVFVRIDPNSRRGEYLYFRILGPGSVPIASFITFRVTEGSVQEVSDTGYFNGAWYKEVHDFSDRFIADVVTRHDKLVEARLVQLAEANQAEHLRNDRYRARFGKPASWTLIDNGPTAGTVSGDYVVWYDRDSFKYFVEVYGRLDQLLAVGSLECSHAPQFGIDAFDHDRIFGQPGVLSQVIATAENA